jgi:hypothetical protein
MTLTFSKLGDYGRFGNQLFQIASTIGIAMSNGHDFEFPEWSYSKYFSHPLPIKSNRKKFEILLEQSTGYNEYKLYKNKNYDLEGYFQSYKYFEKYKEDIEYYFTLRSEFFYSVNPELVSVHVRRTDYLSLQHIHPVLDLDYYIEAVKIFPENYKFIIFSDDISWCRDNFTFRNFEFIENTVVKDFSYMKNCKHNIIANSSFSWWAAYLNPNPEKIVVAPKNYVLNEETDDRVPREWIRL